MSDKPPKGTCLWCGKQCKESRIYCNHSHQQMHFYKTHSAYRHRRNRKKRKFSVDRVNRNIQLVVAAMMLEGERIETI